MTENNAKAIARLSGKVVKVESIRTKSRGRCGFLRVIALDAKKLLIPRKWSVKW